MSTEQRGYDFRSDNVAGMASEVLTALAEAGRGSDTSYGEDAITQRLKARMADLFEREVAVFPVATGTAANALSLAAITPPWGALICHEVAHAGVDECGAPEFYTGGAKVTPLAGENGKLSAETLAGYCSRTSRGVHHMPSTSVTISQSTEAGTVYTLDEIAALSAVCRQHELKLHMDGARFANAVAALSCSPADVTWRAGVDILSFGLTKNGAIAAEAVVVFDLALAENFGYRRKRAGHLFSKMRFASAQIEAQLTDGLWLRLASHANGMAARLALGLQQLPQISLVYPVESNELFVELPGTVASRLESQGYRFLRWSDGDRPCIRLVTAFDTEPYHIDGFISAVAVLAQE